MADDQVLTHLLTLTTGVAKLDGKVDGILQHLARQNDTITDLCEDRNTILDRLAHQEGCAQGKAAVRASWLNILSLVVAGLACGGLLVDVLVLR
jgi:hypothetical protein